MVYRDKDGKIHIIPENLIRLGVLIIGLIIGFYLCKAVDGKASVLSEVGINLKPSSDDVYLLADLIELENGGSVERMYLTGAVVLNRRDYCTWCPNTLKGVIYQKGQYAVVPKLGKKKPSKEAFAISTWLLMFGSNTPKALCFQAQFFQGSKVYKVIDGEYFCLE